jgi:hypothetical protein
LKSKSNSLLKSSTSRTILWRQVDRTILIRDSWHHPSFSPVMLADRVIIIDEKIQLSREMWNLGVGGVWESAILENLTRGS